MLFKPTQHDRPPTTLVECLPALVRRIDRRAFEQMEERVSQTRVDLASLEQEVESGYVGLNEQFDLWRRIHRVLASEVESLNLAGERYQQFSERYFGQLPGQAREALLLNRLEDEADSWWSGWIDRRAVRSGLMGFDAYHERHVARTSLIEARIRVGLLALEQLGRDMTTRLGAGDAHIAGRRLLGDDSVPYQLALDGESPQLRWLGLRAVSDVLQRLFADTDGAVPNRWLNLAVRTAISPRTTVWMQRTALDTLAAAADAGEVLESRLRRPVLPRDDWFVRAHAAKLLARRDPSRALRLFAKLITHESSDAVRIAMCEGLSELVSVAAIEQLQELAAETQPMKVRLAAARALAAATLHGGESGAAASVALVSTALGESDSDVLAVLCDIVLEVFQAGMAAAPEAMLNAALDLRAAVGERLAYEPNHASADQLTRLRLELAALATQEDPLERQLAALEYGESAELGFGTDKLALGRAMARAAREGYGLYARSTRRGTWRVVRGERFRPRLWRVIHELRNPSPSKRQAYNHLRARVFPGRLRAHPVHLGEVTPTTVPGERKQVSVEGGWGPYLPLVDDVLDAQRSGVIEIATSAGLTTVTAPMSLRQRVRNYITVSWRYRELDELRLSSLEGQDEQQRSAYLATIARMFETSTQFQGHFADDPAPLGIRMLVAKAHEQPVIASQAPRPALPEASAAVIAAPAMLDQIVDFARSTAGLASRVGTDLFERGGVQIRDLGVVMIFLLTTFIARLFWVRWSVDRWRRDVPLCIGGWGTRGKSGTERLKAGLFAGLGCDVFVKTTGCEAMFIHSPRGLDPIEVFIYRPYDKASIWEQRDMLRLSRKLDSDVFLWECMALNPRYVEILEWHWMRDDLITLTNAYPDHEDIQGPAGTDVAETIGRFIAPGGNVITSEREMLPVFQRIAHERGASLGVVDLGAELRLSDDVLDRFPYREHPRNIALVAQMADELGIDRDYAVFAMADHVVPDLGVLKEYPRIGLLGRDVRFVNGCSANERAGFMNNWTRMKLDETGSETSSRQHVMTVVNNRADRVSRSIVFADILVRDVTVDRHILIGTNLSGLRNYLDDSLARYLRTVTIVERAGEDIEAAQRRLEPFLRRVRVRPESADSLLSHLTAMAEAAEVTWARSDTDEAELESALAALATPRTSWSEILSAVRAEPTVQRVLGEVRAASDSSVALARREISDAEASVHRISCADVDEVIDFWVERVACTVAHAAMLQMLRVTLEGDLGIDAFHERLREVWRGRFWHTVISVDEADVTGDGIIVRCARQVPPGFEGVLMGTQNIKQTGLDFVYRWVDLDTTSRRLDALVDASEALFQSEMMWLLGSESLHLTEALMAWRQLQALPRRRKCSPRELALVTRASDHLAEVVTARFDKASSTREAPADEDWRERVATALEEVLDPLDAVWRRYRAERLMRLLAAKRISHPRVAELMRDLTTRQKGGWLRKRG